ncbi:MAG: ornithine cyclodeaminase [Segatella copri]|uniref:Ornithine cyclodeaminase n=1 Tax=Hallella faecis TaxID=2841596 RepID=A0ABV1FTU2_9BACT|nr:ornithine cyclodeaminase [Hallella faecis]MBU0291101.1 ornithine cyclodeaminase [Hallella faecis]
MIVIQDREVRSLGLKPKDFIDSVRHCFVHKPECQLPPKISLHPKGDDFINTMPCLLPPETNRYGVKIVSRVKGRTPALKSDSMLYDVTTGELLAVIDCDYITTMRTGAVAALAVDTLKKNNVKKIALMGLGNTGRATMMCLSSLLPPPDGKYEVSLLKYKDQAEQFIEHFKNLDNFHFTIANDTKELFENADVIISCITQANGLFIDDVNVFKPGVLVVPVHTRGFQNCDTIFDKVVCDDIGHVKGFKYFNQFKNLTELGDILRGDKPGRQSEEERIIDYNIGLGLHDAYICSKVYDAVKAQPHENIELVHSTQKYII